MQHHTHNLEYLLKTDDEGNLVGRVLQLPAVIVQGKIEPEIHEKIEKTTYNYLTHFDDDHQRILKNPNSKLLTDAGSGYGIIVGTKQFKVTC